MPMTHEVAQAEVADHAGVAFHPLVLLLLALSLGFGAKWLTPLPLLPDGVALPVGPVVVAPPTPRHTTAIPAIALAVFLMKCLRDSMCPSLSVEVRLCSRIE